MILSYYRGQVTKFQSLPGAMAAVGIALRAPTLSGSPEALDRVLQQISREHPGSFCRRPYVPIAYHSHHMEKIGLAYEKLIKRHLVRNASMGVPMYSTITCDVIASPAELDADYWRRTLDSQVCFYPAVKSLVSQTTENRVFVEIGPHSTQSTPLRDIFRNCDGSSRLDYIPTLVRNRDQWICWRSMVAAGRFSQISHAIRGAMIEDTGTRPAWQENGEIENSDTTRFWESGRLNHQIKNRLGGTVLSLNAYAGF
ncbi:hypothetical protein CNMCM5623_004808 [Aspergillus felis]|uniref:Malonyl-CoA:ACP transacylase (MAT) domain-containing protein n=1 Tax=Aspergillus felis TaxID=1287682 RepID=A0A8H6UQB2_9EURO|nr:hypothetical protein CNMCM5623_004808 [Aspergillus felis]